jgi:GNAT superfamily N-acetyltransferase
MTITIRSFVQNDTQDVLRMIQDLCAFHGDVTQSTSHHIYDAFLGEDNLGHCLVACRDDNVIGFVASYDRMNFIRGKRVCNVDLIFVPEHERGSGIGLLLMIECARWAIRRGCSRMTVTAETNNATAHRFYSKIKMQGELLSCMAFSLADDDLKAFCN